MASVLSLFCIAESAAIDGLSGHTVGVMIEDALSPELDPVNAQYLANERRFEHRGHSVIIYTF